MLLEKAERLVKVMPPDRAVILTKDVESVSVDVSHGCT